MTKISYTKRADGRYQSSVYLGRGNDGKRKYQTVYGSTPKEVKAKIDDIKAKLGKGIDIKASRNTFDFWGQKWLKYKKTDVAESWYNGLMSYYNHLEDFYDCPVDKLSTSDIRELLSELAEQDYSKRVIKAVYNIATGVMDLAVENRAIEYNPFLRIKLPRKTKQPKERRALTKEEQSWIRDTPHRAQTAAMIMMYAGLRRGELIPLQWTDIDLEKKVIKINKSVMMIKGVPTVKQEGKTDCATRTVYIPDILVNYLKSVQRVSFLVCPSSKGTIMSDSAWRRLWESYIKTLNFKYGDFRLIDVTPKNVNQPGGIPIVIPNITAHWLRHTFITEMYLAGVDAMTAKEQAGHRDISTTLKIYTHLDKIYKDKNIQKYNDYTKQQVNVN